MTARPGPEPDVGSAADGVANAALIHHVLARALGLGPDGIRVNAVAPQVIATERNKRDLPPTFLAGAVEPAALAGGIAFLAGKESPPISGAVLPACH